MPSNVPNLYTVMPSAVYLLGINLILNNEGDN